MLSWRAPSPASLWRGTAWTSAKRWRARVALTGASLLGSGVLGSPAFAQSRGKEPAEARPVERACVTWSAPSSRGCPDAERLARAVRDVVGRDVLVTDSPCDVRIEGSVEGGPGSSHAHASAWRISLRLTDARGRLLGERTLESREKRCSAVTGPTSLVLALMIDAGETEATLSAPPPEPLEPPPAAPAPSEQEPPELVTADAPPPARERSALRVTSDVGVTAAYELVPGWAYGLDVGLRFVARGVPPLRLDATLYAPTVEAPSGHGGEFWAWSGRALLCPRLFGGSGADSRSARSELAVCGGAEAGSLRGRAIGLEQAERPARAFAAADARVAARLAVLGPITLSAAAGVAVPLMRPRFTYDLPANGGAREVHRPAAVVPVGALGISVSGPP
jgi:hypothetical protein